MPSYKNYKGYKKSYRKSYKKPYRSELSRWGTWARKGMTVTDVATTALSGVNYLRGLVNSEMFKITTSTGGNLDQAAPYILHATGVAQGDGDGQRTGNSILVRSYNLKGILKFNPAGNAQQTVRVSLVQDTQQLGDTTPAYSDVYQGLTPYSHLNAATVGRFKILSSRMYTLSANRPGIPFSINKSMRHHVRYNGVLSTDIQKGGLYVMLESDSLGANFPSYVAEDRLSYHDN